MMASSSPASQPPGPSGPEQAGQGRRRDGVEAAFRAALIESVDRLPLGDRNLLDFHYFHRVGPDQLAAMFGSPRAAVIRQLARIRERLLRDTRRGLAARLGLDREELDRVLERARRRFDIALARVLRA